MAWAVPPMWKGGDVWILGGGPSITKLFDIPEDVVTGVRDKTIPLSAFSPYLEALHSKHVIGINVAYKIGNWIDIVFFGDDGFFQNHKGELVQFPGLKVSCANSTATFPWVKYLYKDPDAVSGISKRQNAVGWNGNSGGAAISLAVNLGVQKVFLLGFDMIIDPITGAQHWHREYKQVTGKNIPFRRHIKGFPEIAAAAKKMGVQIYNVNPESAIENFEKITLAKALTIAK